MRVGATRGRWQAIQPAAARRSDRSRCSALFGPGVANTLTSARRGGLVAYDSDELSGGDVRVGFGALNSSRQAIGNQFQDADTVSLGIAERKFSGNREARWNQNRLSCRYDA